MTTILNVLMFVKIGDGKGESMALAKLMQIARRSGNHSLAKEYDKQRKDAYRWQ